MPGMVPQQGAAFAPPLMPGESSASQQQQVQGRTQYIQKQQRWLLFLRHCAKCTQTEQECQFSRSCRVGKELWQHILQCTDVKCAYPRCVSSKDLLKHHQKCQVRAHRLLQIAADPLPCGCLPEDGRWFLPALLSSKPTFPFPVSTPPPLTTRLSNAPPAANTIVLLIVV